MPKLDLHTHSTGSVDGGIELAQYQQALDSGVLDYIAITDHDRVDDALAIHQQLGPRIIVGEEIRTAAGEIIGLFLESLVPAGLTPLETVKRIKDQGGLVYIPHPFETIRQGLHPAVLEELTDFIDIIEVYNGRAVWQDYSRQAAVWAKLNHIVGVASSDAHGRKGLGTTYTRISQEPTKQNLLTVLAAGTPIVARPSLPALLYPKYNRLLKKARGQS